MADAASAHGWFAAFPAEGSPPSASWSAPVPFPIRSCIPHVNDVEWCKLTQPHPCYHVSIKKYISGATKTGVPPVRQPDTRAAPPIE